MARTIKKEHPHYVVVVMLREHDGGACSHVKSFQINGVTYAQAEYAASKIVSKYEDRFAIAQSATKRYVSSAYFFSAILPPGVGVFADLEAVKFIPEHLEFDIA